MEQFHNTIRNLRNIGTIDTPNKHLNDRSFSWLGTDTLIKNGGIKLVLLAQNVIS
jgi:hypothetical protein